MSRIRTQVKVGTEIVEIDVHASFAHGIDIDDETMVTAALALNHPMLLDLVRGELLERGVDAEQRRSVELLDARRISDDAPAPRPALSVVPEGWTLSTVEISETTTYRIPVAHPRGAAPGEVAAVGYDDYCQAMRPEFVFAHTIGPDEVSVAGHVHDPGPTDESTPWPSWAESRPAITARGETTSPAQG